MLIPRCLPLEFLLLGCLQQCRRRKDLIIRFYYHRKVPTLSFAFRCAAYALMKVSGCTSRTALGAMMLRSLFLLTSFARIPTD
jgi:hypothetical protein